MAQPYDATTKTLLETRPSHWLALLDRDVNVPVEVIDADLSAVTAQADKVMRVGRGHTQWLLHLELQAAVDRELMRRVRWYNALLDYRHNLPVRSLVVLLRPKAEFKDLTDTFQRAIPGEDPHDSFQFTIVRLWEMPVERLLEGPVGLLPFAPISRVETDELPGVIRRMSERFERELPGVDRDQIWTATWILMGLRHKQPLIDRLLEGVRAMRESVTWQQLMREGKAAGRAEERAAIEVELEAARVSEARRIALLAGTRKFGEPDTRSRQRLDRITDPVTLEEIILRIPEVSSWTELLPTRRRPTQPSE